MLGRSGDSCQGWDICRKLRSKSASQNQMQRAPGRLDASARVSAVSPGRRRDPGIGAAAVNGQRPNVVLIITDDVGYGDFGSYGAPDIKTPNIDRLAKDGVRLTDFYANGATCSPTRTGLISGRYQQRVAIEQPLGGERSRDGARGLPATGRSLPQLLKNNGYATALVGKWHLGYKPEFSPGAHGFDYFFGFKSGFTDYYQHTSGDGAARPVRERSAGGGRRLHDRPHHRAVGAVHRAERAAAVLHRRGVQRRALALPGPRPAVQGARQCQAPRALRRFDEHARRVRRDARTRRSGRRPDPPGARRPRLAAEHDRDLHQRQRRRMVVTQHAALPPQGEACGKAGSGCRRSSAGQDTFRRAVSPPRSGSRWT